MGSTFMGLETSKRGLAAQQLALYTVGHNISNANTIGYSRQRVNLQPTQGFPGVGTNSPRMPGFLGTGVEAGSIERVRDKFVDNQYRQETNKLGFWQSTSQVITQMEDILNEPSDYGLAQTMNEFWNSLQDLSVHPEDGGARAVVVQRGVAVADSFNYMATSLKQVQDNVGKEIGISLRDINSIAEQIANINRQIKDVEPNGYLPNDLYDARDNLVDELSSYFPIDLEYQKSGGNALAISEGSLTISIKIGDKKLKLVDGADHAELRTEGAKDGVTPTEPVTGFYLVKKTLDADKKVVETPVNSDWSSQTKEIQKASTFTDTGKLKSLVNSYGYLVGGTEATDGTEGTKGTLVGKLPDMLANLDKMAQAFAKEFNEIHQGGTDLNGELGKAFFVTKDGSGVISATNIQVDEDIVKDPKLIAASDSPKGNSEPGNGKKAQELANMKFKPINELGNISTQSYFEGLIGQLGVDGQQANRLQYSSETLLQSVTERRASTSSVSLDEEMTNMITFQKAYSASARMITAIDETLDKIINGMGRVGL